MPILDSFKNMFTNDFLVKNKNGITISFNDMQNSLYGLGDLFDNVYGNIASDLSNADIITSNDSVWNKWNMRANDLQTSQTFQEDLYFHLLKYGVAFVDRRKMHVFQNVSKHDFEMSKDNKRISFTKAPYDKLTYGINELYILRLPNKFNTETLNRTIANKYLSLLDSIDKSSKYNLLLKLNTKLRDEDLKELQETMVRASESGTIIVDQKVESVSEMKGTNNFDSELYQFLTTEIYAYFGYTQNLKTLNYTDEEYQHYHFNTLMPILKQVKQEIAYKDNTEVNIVHRSIFTNPENLKQFGMLGIISVNQVRQSLDMPLDANGDKLIQNWNDTSKGGENGEDTK